MAGCRKRNGLQSLKGLAMKCSRGTILTAGGLAVGLLCGSPPPATAESKPAAAPPPPHAAIEAKPAAVDAWSLEEVTAALVACKSLLAGKDLVANPVAPFKHGDCGAPASVELISVGRNPEVTLNPPVTVTCEVAGTLAVWVKSELQPLARSHLGAPIVRIDTMSSYSCRNAYGRKKTRLSEHGRANAIDIRAFVTSKQDEAVVLADWGLTARRQAAVIAAAKAAEARQQATAVATAGKPKDGAAAKADHSQTTTASIERAPARPATATGPATSATVTAVTGTPSQPAAPSTALSLAGGNEQSEGGSTLVLPRLGTLIEGLPGIGRRIPSLNRELSITEQPLSGASRLGGARPKPAGEATASSGIDARRRQDFLHAVHQSACRTFGTVLGPEANAAHENHFHFDMAERNGGHFCE